MRATKEGLSQEGSLQELAKHEEALRHERRTERLLRQSGLPLEKTFRSCDLSRLSPTLQLLIERLKPGTFLESATNGIAVGKGKRHRAAALGTERILAGHAVFWTSTSTLVQRFLAAKRDRRLPQERAKRDTSACVMLDDLGEVQHDREEMDVLFPFLSERDERTSVMIPTNLVLSEWERIFKDPLTTLAVSLDD